MTERGGLAPVGARGVFFTQATRQTSQGPVAI